jgi:hypothetical protein
MVCQAVSDIQNKTIRPASAAARTLGCTCSEKLNDPESKPAYSIDCVLHHKHASANKILQDFERKKFTSAAAMAERRMSAEL